MMQTHARNADLDTLVTMLKEQEVRKLDLVIPASRMSSVEGQVKVSGVEPILLDDGVMEANGSYAPTTIFDEGISDRLGIPLAYVRRLRAERPDLMDANVNGWLHGRQTYSNTDGPIPVGYEGGDARSFLLRTFRGDNGDPGIARALLSDRFAMIDNLDVLMAALDGVRSAGVEVSIEGADLTHRRMNVRISCPEISALAPILLDGYRSPFTGQLGADNPTVFAGFQITNSEVGGGAFSITPRLVIEVCKNGAVMTKDAVRQVHLGGRLDQGVVMWSGETQEKSLALVKSQTVDAVRTFLDIDYMREVISQMESKAGVEVKTVDEVRAVTRSLGYSKSEMDGILSHFIQGSQTTLGGVAQAVTAYAQTVDSGDQAHDLEASAMKVLGL